MKRFAFQGKPVTLSPASEPPYQGIGSGSQGTQKSKRSASHGFELEIHRQGPARPLRRIKARRVGIAIGS